MGRIKTQQIKSKGEEIYALYGKEYTSDFVENKKKVKEHTRMQSKKLRNILTGYLTRKAKKTE